MAFTTQHGKEYFSAEKTATDLIALKNHTNIELGIVLIVLEEYHREFGEEMGSFATWLATKHLNYRRVYKLLKNSQFILDMNVDRDYWKFLDSSVLEWCRKTGRNPVSIIDDIKTLSFTDLKERY